MISAGEKHLLAESIGLHLAKSRMSIATLARGLVSLYVC